MIMLAQKTDRPRGHDGHGGHGGYSEHGRQLRQWKESVVAYSTWSLKQTAINTATVHYYKYKNKCKEQRYMMSTACNGLADC